MLSLNLGSCCASADGSTWKKTEVNSSLSFYQLQGLTPGSHYRLRFTYRNSSSFWEKDINTEGTGMKTVLPSFILFTFILPGSPLGFPHLNIKPTFYRECLAVPHAVCEVLSKTYVEKESC